MNKTLFLHFYRKRKLKKVVLAQSKSAFKSRIIDAWRLWRIIEKFSGD